MNTRIGRRGGFTLVELTVVVAIIVALAAVVVPMVGAAKLDGQVAQILQVVDSLRTSCQRFHADTSKCAVEQSGTDQQNRHQLAVSQNLPGWDGPYISQVLSRSDNPFGGQVQVFNTHNLAYQGGFRLTGDGDPLTAKGEGNHVRFTAIPEKIARRVDEALDESVPGNWKQGGRVTYSGKKLYVFLMDTDGK